MKHFFRYPALGLLLLPLVAFAQVPVGTQVAILKAEDARDYDGLKPFIFSKNPKIQERAVLAAARIGEGSSVDALAGLLENGDPSIRPLAAFALGETEAEHAAVFILRALSDAKTTDAVRARAVEAAGKIAAANPKGNDFKALGTAILDTLNAEAGKGKGQNRETVLLALTAALRARPEGADVVTAKFLTNADAAIRTSAGNTMARLRGKNANVTLRTMLASDTDPSARANAARALGAAEDKEAFDVLMNAALSDKDSRVRASSIRSLGSLKDPSAANELIKRGETLLQVMKGDPAYVVRFQPPPRSKAVPNPSEKSEFLEIATALGRIAPNTDNARAVKMLSEFRILDSYEAPETEIAFALISPREYWVASLDKNNVRVAAWKQMRSAAQGLVQFAKLDGKGSELGTTENPESVLAFAVKLLSTDLDGGKDPDGTMPAFSDSLRAYAEFKPKYLGYMLSRGLGHSDVFARAASAGVMADQPTSKENVDALKTAFAKALLTDKHDNDAQLAILDALYKLDKKGAVGTLLVALNATDYLVRKKAFEMLADKDLHKEFPTISTSLENARAKNKDKVLPYSPAFGTKLGQVLNNNIDYRRALSRRKGSIKAVLTTEKGTFTIDFFPEDAPLTVDNFIKLARSGYFNGLEVHRVVPNFVMQDGDPRGDGNGGPGWSIRCEMNMIPFDRGTVGMALSGKDTGGSQWFVTHAPQPHLDGGYTVFGRVNETDMKVVDNIVRGDKILTVRIVEGNSTQRPPRTQR